MDFSKEDSETLYSGKWTGEEEVYVKALVEEFRAGTLDIPEGTSLRCFLARMLDCKPKRISKKYERSGYIGKRLFSKRGDGESQIDREEAKTRRSELLYLKRQFIESRKRVETAKASKTAPRITSSVMADPEGPGRVYKFRPSENTQKASLSSEKTFVYGQHGNSYIMPTTTLADSSKGVMNGARSLSFCQALSSSPDIGRTSVPAAATVHTPMSQNPFFAERQTSFGAVYLNAALAAARQQEIAHTAQRLHREQLLSTILSVMRIPQGMNTLHRGIREEDRKRHIGFGNILPINSKRTKYGV